MSSFFDLLKALRIEPVQYNYTGVNTPKMFHNRHCIPPGIREKVNHALEEAFDPYKKALVDDFETGFKKLMKVDDWSTREFLKRGGPDGCHHHDFDMIQWMETLDTGSNLYDQAFSESVLDSLAFDYAPKVDWFRIDRGSSVLIDALAAGLKTKVQTKTRVVKISDNPDDDTLSVGCTGESEDRTGYCTVFNTTSLGCLGHMDLVDLNLCPKQQDAIQCLHYDDSVKVALQFSAPWWVTLCGINEGGAAATDLPIRTVVYPSNSQDNEPKLAVLLASYTWGQDATRLGSLAADCQQPNTAAAAAAPDAEQQLVSLVLSNLAKLHDMDVQDLQAYYTGKYHVYHWAQDPRTAGAFALFGPGQFSNFYPCLTKPAANGKFLFVGEAASAHHAWVAGSTDSAHAALTKFFFRPYMPDAIRQLGELPGFDKELDMGRNGTLHLQLALAQQGAKGSIFENYP